MYNRRILSRQMDNPVYKRELREVGVARRTKEDAEATRERLLDAAEQVFYVRGVSGASLADVANRAGLTRGAVYWHFKDKLDLFDAMMQRVTLPIEQVLKGERQGFAGLSPVGRIVRRLAFIARAVSIDERVRRVFEIALFKVEHVGELVAVQQRWVLGADRITSLLEQDLAMAYEELDAAPALPVGLAAKGLQVLFDGLLHAWLLRQGGFSLEVESRQLTQFYLKGLGLAVDV